MQESAWQVCVTSWEQNNYVEGKSWRRVCGEGSRWGGLPWADGAAGTSGVDRHGAAGGSKLVGIPGSPVCPSGCTPIPSLDKH